MKRPSRSFISPHSGVAGLAAATLLLTPFVAAAPAAAAPDGSDLVINEVYARGGSANQPFTHKFVELFNPTDEEISVEGLSVQYRSAAGTGNSNGVVALTGCVGPGGYYLIAGGSNGSNGVALPAADASGGGLNPSGTTGTVALIDGTAAITLPIGDVTDPGDDRIVDLVGYGTSNTYEGALATMTGSNATPLSIFRTNGADTDNNDADFSSTDTPTPQNAGEYECADGNGDPDPEPQEVSIAEIQGTGDSTPLDGQTVTTHGVVTGVYPAGGFNGAFIQTEGTGGDLEDHDASHGIFVFGGNTGFANTVEIGDFIEVTGTAGEYFGLTQLGASTWTVLTEEHDPAVPAQIPLPAMAEREAFEGMLLAPQGAFTITDTYHTNRFGWVGLAAGTTPLAQPTDVIRPRGEDATAYDAFVAANADREIRMDDGSSFDWTNFNFDDHEIPVAYLDPSSPPRVGAAATFDRPVILDFRRTVANQDSTWTFQPTTRLTGLNADEVQPISWEKSRPSAEGAEDVGGDVTLATFNVLNYFTSLGEDELNCGYFADREGQATTSRNCAVRGAYDAANLARQTEKIVAAITALDADVVALQEIENSISFVEGNAPEDRDHALSGLVEALNAKAGDGVWSYVESAPEFPAAEDVIRNAFIYQSDAVAPVGETTILLDDMAFYNAREPMAQEFAPLDDTGTVIDGADTFIVINNHFKSKGSGEGVNADQGDGQGASNPDRIAQAHALVGFAADVSAEAGTDLVFLAGDFNSYTMEDPMVVFADAGYTNIAQTMTEKSTYSFDSRVGSLDHVLGNDAATDAVTGADIWNINAYESIALEYSRYNYNVTDFHDASPFRASDHDPIIVGIDLDLPEPEPTDPRDMVAALRASVDAYVAAGDIAGPIAHQLANALKQADKHLEGGRLTPATKAVEQVIRHLENPKRPDTLSAQAQADLLEQARRLLAAIGRPA